MAKSGTRSMTAEVTLYTDDRGCTAFKVHVLSTSAVGCIVRIPGLHATGEGIPIEPGYGETFRNGDMGIKIAYCAGNSGTADVNFGPVAVTTKS